MAKTTKRNSRKGKSRPHYTPEQRAHAVALATTYGNVERAAREVGMPARTLHRWMKEPSEATAGIVKATNRSIVESLTASMMEAHDMMLDYLRRGEGNTRDRIIAFGVLADKKLAHEEAERKGGANDAANELEKIAEALRAVE